MKIKTTNVTQTANETLGTKEKKLYYLIITTDNYKEGTAENKLVVNVGEKTHDCVMALIQEEENDKGLQKTHDLLGIKK